MKVLITSDWYAPVINGVVTSVLLLQRELEKLGHEVRVVTLSNSLHTYKDGNVYYMGSVSANKIYPGARLKINRSRSLLHELVAWGPDVIHSQCEFSSFRVAYGWERRWCPYSPDGSAVGQPVWWRPAKRWKSCCGTTASAAGSR